MSRCASCAGGAAAVSRPRFARFAAVDDYAAQAASLDTAPRTPGQLRAGDVVLTAFTQEAGVDGTRVAGLLPTVNIAQGTTLYIARYAFTDAPSTDAPLTNTFTLTAPATRGVPLAVSFDTGVYDGLLLQQRDGAEVGRTPEGERWDAAADLSDTAMVYTVAGSRGMVPLHAVGFRTAGGTLPNYGTLSPEHVVTLPQGGTLLGGNAAFISMHPLQGASSASDTLLLPQELRSIARRMALNGGLDWVTASGAFQPAYMTARTLVSPGAWTFTRYKRGSASTGFTEFDVMALRAAPTGTSLTFTPTLLDPATMTHTGTETEEFTLSTPADMAAGDVVRVRVGQDSGGAAVHAELLRPSSAPEDWTSSAVINAGYTLTAEDWTAVTLESRAVVDPTLVVTVGCVLRHDRDVQVPADMALVMPPSCSFTWPAQGVLLSGMRAKWSAAVLGDVYRAAPQAGTEPLRIIA
uniref:Uncharacterized protein n=1 Tax=viral metagenome TaxID=1070528 RepID=A0A6C0ASX4_9ZZZZ